MQHKKKDSKFCNDILSNKTIEAWNIVPIFHRCFAHKPKKGYYLVETCCFIKATVFSNPSSPHLLLSHHTTPEVQNRPSCGFLYNYNVCIKINPYTTSSQVRGQRFLPLRRATFTLKKDKLPYLGDFMETGKLGCAWGVCFTDYF